ncbi:MAG: T9SS type A sorting domain-containing protein [Bacteroidetes bacterium]|nr:T9SS type A sorting domain-containing protein [Bacteroidota bacterium]
METNKIDLSTLESGFYWLIIKDGDTMITIRKVIKL